MEAALVSAATGALKPVLGKLGALLGDKYKRFKGVRKDIKSLRNELVAMDAFLTNMSEEEDPDVQDKVWMNEVRELSYDMEDCIDDFMQSINDNDTKPNGLIEKIKNLLGKIKSRRRIGNEIHDLKKQITEVGERNQRYKTEVGKRNARYKTVQAFSETINGTIDTRALVIFDHVSKIVGIDESKTDIIKLLTEEDGRQSKWQLQIVSIVGSAGVGKTTLANQVYQEHRRGFKCHAFLSVSRSPNIMNILRTIFSKVSDRPYAGTEEGSAQQLAMNIYEFLEDKSCDGGCRRSFHPTIEHGEDSMCRTLGLTEEQWQTHVALEDADLYICKNCEYKQHQCFACGLLGSSDLKSGPEVFQCTQPRCGHFYHPNCVAKLLYPDSEDGAVPFEQRVAGGREFYCPLHQCKRCKETENKHDKEMQLAVCRRCPTAYHRKCLPSNISFEEIEEMDIPQRAWEKVLPNKILIYCMKHRIQRDLQTPKRDHIVFPDARNASAAKRARGAPQQHDVLEEDELLDCPSSSEPSQSPRPAETGHDRVMPIDSFAPKHLFPRPQPGSCGWLDE